MLFCIFLLSTTCCCCCCLPFLFHLETLLNIYSLAKKEHAQLKNLHLIKIFLHHARVQIVVGGVGGLLIFLG
jgi:hypothetical protein